MSTKRKIKMNKIYRLNIGGGCYKFYPTLFLSALDYLVININDLIKTNDDIVVDGSEFKTLTEFKTKIVDELNRLIKPLKLKFLSLSMLCTYNTQDNHIKITWVYGNTSFAYSDNIYLTNKFNLLDLFKIDQYKDESKVYYNPSNHLITIKE